jgi:hypothetical protein
VERLRFLVFAVFFVSAAGTGAELFLLEHTESVWQLVPLAALGAGVLVGAAVVARPRAATVRAFQAAMVLFVASGVTGLYLHYRGNVEFELEMYPALAGAELVWKALTGATPALAPGVMVQLGVLGLLACFRHPALRPTVPAGRTSGERTPA